MQTSVENLPSYLKRYCSIQDYSKYTSQDHAAWRYIMRQSKAYFKEHAVPVYLDGLKRTAVPVDRIPKISDMDMALGEFGWGAVPVCGFIPPIAFLDFQARGLLAIATDMRTIDHIGYTPAPDIVHEAAGHAPIVADPGYRQYLRRYAAVAKRAIMSREDLNLYEAIRILSDIKENPDTKPSEVERAQKSLDRAVKNVSYVSEATKVSRMAWWTVEYGLVGKTDEPKIYGAGLLSSVGESQACLSRKVRKIPFTLKCIETTFDITEPQPQLFVAESMEHLTEVLLELEKKMSFELGGVHGLEEARKAETVNTIVLDSGIQVSGILTNYEAAVDSGRGEPSFIKMTGPVQLSLNDVELPNQGRVRHPEGFSSPLGRWVKATHKSPHKLTSSELESLGLKIGAQFTLEFVNGFRVEGVVTNFVRQNGDLVLVTWNNATVTRGSKRYYEPSWGPFDMVVGESVVSAFGGPADREQYGEYEMGGVSTQPGRTSPYSDKEKNVFSIYDKIREFRTNPKSRNYDSLFSTVQGFSDLEWLLALELYEISHGVDSVRIRNFAKERLDQLKQESSPEISELITKGMQIAHVAD